ncbi:hypothetical protein L198_06619 [Cryptococcus wingfieldii CBS 7118]|uniref:Uncharacterized protein n=1 Tax=Cryptococcus wingfieldii CBS 7118 TaxID=1295528 RepID=A0A1E3IJP0_9TREE|nr:hypothetical protein L198_06619 [Cryptococcus wingfieldii CBS 7118]ODN88817.1 hypothetical protein L198_06619 [Cryptococcus wingfieldii CBS 7118]
MVNEDHPPQQSQSPSQKPKPLDDAILEEFYKYVNALVPTEIPKDKRLEKWTKVRVGDLLEVGFLDEFVFQGQRTPYRELMESAHSERIDEECAHETEFSKVLFPELRRPETFSRTDLPKRNQVDLARGRMNTYCFQHQHWKLDRTLDRFLISMSPWKSSKHRWERTGSDRG